MDTVELANTLTNGLTPERKEEVDKVLIESVGRKKFIPSPGPQTDAWFCKADVLLYGGEAGGGKSGLLCGLALENHKQSLLLRRNGVDLEGGGGLIEDLLRIYGTREGFSGKPPPTLKTDAGRIVTFGSCTNIGDEQKYQGRARDLLGLDEATQFAETQVRFLMGWVRTVNENQQTRAVLATNPPMSSEGDWIIGMFRPWLDPTHENPAEHGELRWFITVREGYGTMDIEVDGPTTVQRDGEELIPSSRTFIPAKLADNPFIITRDYQKQLDALPEPYRSSARDGNFMAARVDNAFQVIPTQWIREAQARWKLQAEERGYNEPPEHAPMSAMAIDIAQGGADNTIISIRYDAWFQDFTCVPGEETPTGNEVAGLIIARRRAQCPVILDMGGGYGGSTLMRLNDNAVEPIVKHKGAEGSNRRSADKTLGFYNKRAEVYWRLREALDPGQDGGSRIAIPDDAEMTADMTSLEYEITSQGIKVTPKDRLVKKLGRSPDKGDAIAMCNAYGPNLMTHGNQWRDYTKTHGSRGSASVNVVQSRMAARRSRS
jgi:hypothetical protein